ncbi:MAG: radical SAM protein [Bdellovibrionota bacterium]
MNSQGPQFLEAKVNTVRSFNGFLDGENRPSHPLNVFLEVSNLCNMSCFMCVLFSSLNQNRTSDITARERGLLQFKDTTEKMANLAPGLLSVHLFGYGEPTIHPQFRSFVEFFGKHEVMIDFFTNGMNLDLDMARFLVEQNVFNVTFSFSGATREEYENVYLGGKFDTVVASMKNLAAEKIRQNKSYPKISVNSIAFQHHVDRFDEFVDFMTGNGVNEISVKPLQEYGNKIEELQGHSATFKAEKEQAVLARALAKARSVGSSIW